MTELDTSETVLRARGGDRSAVEALVRRFLRPAYLVALSVLRVPADAEDVAQEAVAMAMQQLETCRDPARFSSWLMAGVRNRAFNLLAHGKVKQAFADGVNRQEQAMVADADRLVLRQQLLVALEVLTAQQREVVLLHDLESWTHPEIAMALGLTEVNSRQLLSVARKALRAKLAAMDSVEA